MSKNYYTTEYRLRPGRTREPRKWVRVTAIPEMSGTDPALVRLCIQLRGFHDNCEYRIVRYARAEHRRVNP